SSKAGHSAERSDAVWRRRLGGEGRPPAPERTSTLQKVHAHPSEVDDELEVHQEILAYDPDRMRAIIGLVHGKGSEGAGPFIDTNLDVLDFLTMFLCAT